MDEKDLADYLKSEVDPANIYDSHHILDKAAAAMKGYHTPPPQSISIKNDMLVEKHGHPYVRGSVWRLRNGGVGIITETRTGRFGDGSVGIYTFIRPPGDESSDDSGTTTFFDDGNYCSEEDELDMMDQIGFIEYMAD